MKKSTMKAITVIITVLLFLTISGTYFSVYATDIVSQINGDASVNSQGMITAGNKIATIIRIVGAVAAVIILMILGIKYMMGSASEKAEYKKTMIPYVVGAIILFGATAIAGAVVELAGGITTDSTGVTPPPRTSISGHQQ